MGGLQRRRGQLHPHLAHGGECRICPKSPKNTPGEPRKPCSRSQQLPKTGITLSTSLHLSCPSLVLPHQCHSKFSLEMRQRSQIPEETSWHVFPMKSPQKEAKQPAILDISSRFPRCVWSVLGHCCVPLSPLCWEGAAPHQRPGHLQLGQDAVCSLK